MHKRMTLVVASSIAITLSACDKPKNPSTSASEQGPRIVVIDTTKTPAQKKPVPPPAFANAALPCLSLSDDTMMATRNLFSAILEGDVATVRTALAESPNVECVDERGNNALNALFIERSRRNDIPALAALLQTQGAKLNHSGSCNALFTAAQKGDSTLVEQLLAHGAAIDGLDKQGRTALIIALSQRQFAVASVLLEAGADPNIAHNKRTALESVQRSGHKRDARIKPLTMYERLLEAGADPKQGTFIANSEKNCQVRLLANVVQRYPDSVAEPIDEYLLALETNCAEGWLKRGQLTQAQLLQRMAQHGYLRLLRQRAAKITQTDLNQADRSGNTPLMLAIESAAQSAVDAADMVQLLLELGADPQLANTQGKTALMVAAEKGSRATLEHLLAADANVNHATKRGMTALKLAQQRQDSHAKKIVERLQQAGATKTADVAAPQASTQASTAQTAPAETKTETQAKPIPVAKITFTSVDFALPMQAKNESDLVVGKERCTHWIATCSESSERSLDNCFYSAPRCQTSEQENAFCCPTACFERYQAVRNAGMPPRSALSYAFAEPNSCYPSTNPNPSSASQ